jgi:maleylpyruvate isomerase
MTTPPAGDPRATVDSALAELSAATGRLLVGARKLNDAALAQPSRLPGWTRGHVITHIARNADGFSLLLDGLVQGRDVSMYPSAQARDADIEAGSGRPAREQVDDLDHSAARFASLAASLPEALLDQVVHFGLGRIPVPAREAPLLRIREVQIHHVDLGVGFAPDDWPTAFSGRTLDQLVPFFRDQRSMPVRRLVDPGLGRTWTVADTGADLTGAAATLAAWLVGRSIGADLEMSDGSAVPSAPVWV